MKQEPINKTEAFWDKMAKNYDREERSDVKTNLSITEKLKSLVSPSDAVLDFACGTGFFSTKIASSVHHIDAIDIASKMIERAKINSELHNISNINYHHTNIFDEKLKPGTYDCIMALYIFHLLEDSPTTIQRIKELLKSGGKLISVTPCMGEKPFVYNLLSLISRLGLVPKIKGFKRYNLEQIIKQNGFEITISEKLVGTSNQYYIVANK